MRIISGAQRGLKLATLGKGDAAAHLRPTSDRVRESIFNLLVGGAFGDPVSGARVLDLFAGTGALGLEALSRGAAQATFVDNGAKSLSLIRRNIDLCNADAHSLILRQDAMRLGNCGTAPYDLIFLDPPYSKGLGEKVLTLALTRGWLSTDALVVFEEGRALPSLTGFDLLDQRRYGDSYLTIMRPEVSD